MNIDSPSLSEPLSLFEGVVFWFDDLTTLSLCSISFLQRQNVIYIVDSVNIVQLDNSR